MGWLPWIDDPDVTDPRYDETWAHLYDDFGDKILWDNITYKQMAFFLSGLPVVGDIGIMADSFRSFNDYMKNTGLTWDDVMYPWLTGRRFGVGSSGYHALNFVSSNLNKLYR